MTTSLATATPNVPTMTTERVHQVTTWTRKWGWRCMAKGCMFHTDVDTEAVSHVIRNQWVARGPLPAELQLSPEQEAA